MNAQANRGGKVTYLVLSSTEFFVLSIGIKYVEKTVLQVLEIRYIKISIPKTHVCKGPLKT